MAAARGGYTGYEDTTLRQARDIVASLGSRERARGDQQYQRAHRAGGGSLGGTPTPRGTPAARAAATPRVSVSPSRGPDATPGVPLSPRAEILRLNAKLQGVLAESLHLRSENRRLSDALLRTEHVVRKMRSGMASLLEEADAGLASAAPHAPLGTPAAASGCPLCGVASAGATPTAAQPARGGADAGYLEATPMEAAAPTSGAATADRGRPPCVTSSHPPQGTRQHHHHHPDPARVAAGHLGTAAPVPAGEATPQTPPNTTPTLPAAAAGPGGDGGSGGVGGPDSPPPAVPASAAPPHRQQQPPAAAATQGAGADAILSPMPTSFTMSMSPELASPDAACLATLPEGAREAAAAAAPPLANPAGNNVAGPTPPTPSTDADSNSAPALGWGATPDSGPPLSAPQGGSNGTPIPTAAAATAAPFRLPSGGAVCGFTPAPLPAHPPPGSLPGGGGVGGGGDGGGVAAVPPAAPGVVPDGDAVDTTAGSFSFELDVNQSFDDDGNSDTVVEADAADMDTLGDHHHRHHHPHHPADTATPAPPSDRPLGGSAVGSDARKLGVSAPPAAAASKALLSPHPLLDSPQQERVVASPLHWARPEKLCADLSHPSGVFRPLRAVEARRCAPAPLVSLLRKDQHPAGVMTVPEGLRPPVVEGEWEPMLAEGRLFKLLVGGAAGGGGGGKTLMFYNGTCDTHFILEYSFGPQSVLKAGPKTSVEGAKYTVEVPSGETVLFVSGVINGYNVSVRYGPPSHRFIQDLLQLQDVAVSDALNTLRAKAVQHGVDMANDKDVVALCDRFSVPFVDCRFPPRQNALFRPWEGEWDVWPWLRPQSYLPPEFTARIGVRDPVGHEGFVPNDIAHGKMEITWLPCALAVLAEHPDLIDRIFNVPEMGLAACRRTGAYPLRVCKHGWWQVVVVDAYLPSTGKSQVFTSNVSGPHVMWAAVLEKCIAKVHGSYYAVSNGDTLELLQDLTGCPAQALQWGSVGAWETLAAVSDTMYSERHLAFAEACTPDEDGLDAFFDTTGLIPGYCYAITAAKVLKSRRLVRLRNPWPGHSQEVLNCFFDTADIEAGLGVDEADPFSFWVPFVMLQKYFVRGGVCVGPPVGVSPRACDIRIATALKNGAPLHMLEVWASEPCACIIGVHQRDRRGLEETDPDTLYAKFVVTVVEPRGETGWAVPEGGASNQGCFSDSRDIFLHASFQKVGLRPTYVVWRSNLDDKCQSKQIVVSVVSARPFGSINIKQPSPAVMAVVRSGAYSSFDPTGCLNAFSRVQLNQRDHTVRTVDMNGMFPS